MKNFKKSISLVLILCMVFTALPSFATTVTANQASAKDTPVESDGAVLFVHASHFEDNLGTWSISDDSAKGAKLINCLVGSSNQKPEETIPAAAAIEIAESGEYTIWANTRDFTSDPGNRFCNISVNDVMFEKIVGNTKNDNWEFINLGTVNLEKGVAIIRVHDTGAYWARVQGIVLSKDKNFVPTSVEKLASENNATKLDIEIPGYSDGNQKGLEFKDEYSYIILAPETFNELGDWTYTPNTDAGGYVSYYLKGTSEHKEAKKSATINIDIEKDGLWRLLSLSREYTYYVGERYFDIQIGSYQRQSLGVHGQNGWAWEATNPFPMFSGKYPLNLIDASGNTARVAMLILTDDPDFMPENNAKTYKLLCEKTYKDGMYTVPEKTKTPDLNRPGTDIAVKLNGNYLTFDVEPQIMNGRTMVPFRAIFEKLGCSVEWNANANAAKGIRNGKAVCLVIGSKTATVDGKATSLDQEAVIVDGRTLVPLRFVAEALGAAVDWNGDTRTVSIMAEIPEPVYWFDAESFTENGTWNMVDDEAAALGTFVLKSATDAVLPTDGKPENTKPATVTFTVAEDGEYYVWARGKDYATNQPGTRYFNVGVNGSMIPDKFGTHGAEGFKWARAKDKIVLKKGVNTFEVYDTSNFWARFDSALICKSEDFVPYETLIKMMALASPVREANDDLWVFPLYATELGIVTETATIDNGITKVVFYKVQTSKGPVVQNEIYAKDASGNYVLTKTRDEALGFCAVNADTVSWERIDDHATFRSTYTSNGAVKNYYGFDPYKAGNGEWFVPADFTQNGNSVNLIFNDGTFAKMSATYTLEENVETPLVSVDLTALNDGYYTLAAWEGGLFTETEFTDAVAPYRVIKKKVHDNVCAIVEQYMFTPMGTYTLTANNKYGAAPVTKGIVVDPDFMRRGWSHEYDGAYAINMRTPDLNYRATVFSPILGTEESKLAQGGTYNFKYRVISRVADWFDTYKYIAKDLYDVTDYRQNTYATLNDAIFNTRKLMLDDFYGGWDTNAIGYYNIEAMNTATDANPMQAVQDYLLSDDEEFLERRTIPHMAALLSRPGLHFNPTTKAYGVLTGFDATIDKDYDRIGSPRSGYNLNVFGGIYEFTRGNTPVMYDIGLEKGKSGVVNAYGNIAPFSNNLNMYLYTGEKSYLEEAIRQADAYLVEDVYSDREGFSSSWDEQIYSGYFPNLGSLLDIYEVTKDQKYLDAAETTAQMIMTSLWVSGIQNGRGEEPVIVNDMEKFWYRNAPGTDAETYAVCWHGDEGFRLGYIKGLPAKEAKVINFEPETVERWVPERVGLGLEAHSTLKNGSANIIMQYWAGDFMRLAQYTGETAFSDAARNAIIGRFANYSGYYITDYATYQMKESYPYEGPDVTGIYYHHLPPFLAMLEDFLFGQVQNWSGGNIEFPSLRQQGYAYFNSKQFGHKPGKFFTENDMWPYLAENTIDSGNLQIDWLAARKDGKLGIALMNESNDAVTTTVSLLEGLAGNTYTGEATVFNKDGSTETVNVNGGKFEITIPGKTLRAVLIAIPEMKAPTYAKSEYTLDGNVELGATVSEHKNGKGYTLQISPEHYFAYVYITDTPKNGVTELELTYTAGGKTETLKDNVYPFEFIVKVDDENAEFNYSLKANGKDYGKGTLMTKALSEQKGIKEPIKQETQKEKENSVEIKPDEEILNRIETSFTVKEERTGETDKFRIIVPVSGFPFEVSENILRGLPVVVKATSKSNGDIIEEETVIFGNEMRGSSTVLVIEPIGDLKIGKSIFENYKFEVTFKGKN